MHVQRCVGRSSLNNSLVIDLARPRRDLQQGGLRRGVAMTEAGTPARPESQQRCTGTATEEPRFYRTAALLVSLSLGWL